jgi:HlyD family secretion protein
MTRTRLHGLCTRNGFSYRGLLLAMVPLVGVPAIAYSVWPRASAEESVPTHVVEWDEFVHEITDRGNVESASNVEIRCEVKARGRGTMILEVVPEGVFVQPGDLLIRLDASGLEGEQTLQQIAVNTAEAALTQARNVYDTAVIAKREYEEGTFKQSQQELQAARDKAAEMLRQAQDYYQVSKRLADKGYVTELQLEADRFAMENARLNLDSALTNLKVLEEFSRKKTLIQLDSDIRTAEARLKSAEASYQLELDKLELLVSQIEKCTIRSPQAGQVVYANVQDHHGLDEVIIEEGAEVREGQALIRLPDPKQMQVKANIAEGCVTMVERGMTARIRLDAFPDLELHVVAKVNDYPEPTSFFGSTIKEYATTVTILDPPSGVRPGLTAEVKILIERLPKALQVPVGALIQHGANFYCAVAAGGGWKARQVQIGPTNDKTVVIEKGLEAGQVVAAKAEQVRDRITLPDVPGGADGSARAGKRF